MFSLGALLSGFSVCGRDKVRLEVGILLLLFSSSKRIYSRIELLKLKFFSLSASVFCFTSCSVIFLHVLPLFSCCALFFVFSLFHFFFLDCHHIISLIWCFQYRDMLIVIVTTSIYFCVSLYYRISVKNKQHFHSKHLQ